MGFLDRILADIDFINSREVDVGDALIDPAGNRHEGAIGGNVDGDHIEPASISTDREFTESRNAYAVIHEDDGTYHADGPVNINSGGDFGNILQSVIDEISGGDTGAGGRHGKIGARSFFVITTDITSEITVKDGAFISGSTPAQNNDAPHWASESNGDMFGTDPNADNVGIENLHLNGKNIANHAIHHEATRGTFKHLFIEKCPGDAIRMDGKGTITRLRTPSNVDGNAVTISASEVVVENCDCGAGTNGYEVTGGAGWHITDSVAYVCGNTGFRIGGDPGVVSNCDSHDNNKHGYFSYSGRTRFIGCEAYNNGQDDTLDTDQRAGFRLNQPSELVGCTAYDKQSTPTQQYGAVLNADGARVNGGRYFDNAIADILVTASTVEAVLDGVDFGTIEDNGTRTVINGNSVNAGDPSAEGEWNGHAGFAYDAGVTVWDNSTSPSTPYRADNNGNWVAM